MDTILHVEDDESNASVLQDIFAFDGINAKLITVESGEEAIRRIDSIQPSLILMDLRLPGIDGLETTQLLKTHTRTKNIPVWAVTAYAMSGDDERAFDAGCSEYFTKPVNTRELAGKIKEFLKIHRHEEALECTGKHTS